MTQKMNPFQIAKMQVQNIYENERDYNKLRLLNGGLQKNRMSAADNINVNLLIDPAGNFNRRKLVKNQSTHHSTERMKQSKASHEELMRSMVNNNHHLTQKDKDIRGQKNRLIMSKNDI